MSEPTPGPWCRANGNEIHDKPTHYDESGSRTGDTPNRIAVVEYPYGDSTGQDANAALIAAAPTMRDALRDIATGRVTGENAAALARCVLGGIGGAS